LTITAANNHALDYCEQGLLNTLDHLKAGGIQVTGAGRTIQDARRPVILQHPGVKIGIIGFTDHPAEFAATPDRPGVAHVDLVRHGVLMKGRTGQGRAGR
jgi:poly-gamma-glutamate capsule biosynthesis protein CapA/YwtB (metallophosphatase superfamily)